MLTPLYLHSSMKFLHIEILIASSLFAACLPTVRAILSGHATDSLSHGLGGKFAADTTEQVETEAAGWYDAPPSPTMNSTHISCALQKALELDNITLLGANHTTLQKMQESGRVPRRWKTCAVVSSSGVVSLNNHSKEIDSADAVMHFNTAPLQGFEGWVGSRDDVRFVNNQFAGLVLKNSTDLRVDKRTIYIEVLPFEGRSREAEQQQYQELLQKHPGITMLLAPDSLTDRVTNALRYIYSNAWFEEQGVSYMPTTGGVGMLMALSLCDEVRAFGMAESERARSAPYHYYDGEGTVASTQNFHKSFTAEKELWRRLSVSQLADIDASDVATIPGFSQYNCANFASVDIMNTQSFAFAGATPPLTLVGLMLLPALQMNWWRR
mmetsp:Transcript_65326/g.156159  ORF Transcript_65326/g.156159 Transcript_65326/m.156159 type:complete len:382 (-) Transcript_65326:113-1258(-)